MPDEPPDVFGERYAEFCGASAGTPMLGRFEGDLGALHHDGAIIAALPEIGSLRAHRVAKEASAAAARRGAAPPPGGR